MKEAEKNVETLRKGMKKSKRMPIIFLNFTNILKLTAT